MSKVNVVTGDFEDVPESERAEAAEGSQQNSHEAVEVITARLDFYMDKYRFMQKIVGGQLLLTMLMGYGLYEVYANPPKPQYIAAESDGRIIPLVPLNRPTLSKNALLTWSREATTAIYTWDYVNYRQQFQGMQDYFSEDGWKLYTAQLDSSGTFTTVKDRSMLVSGVVDTPVVVDEGVKPSDGIYRWYVEMPVDVTYTPFGQAPVKQHLIVRLTLIAVSPLVNPRAVAIEGLASTEK